MSMAVLDGSAVRFFMRVLRDEATFYRSVDDRFLRLHTNRDGLLSYPEFLQELQKLRVLNSSGFGEFGSNNDDQQLHIIYRTMFQAFDCVRSEAINLVEFRTEMKQMMLSVADKFSALPVQMLLEDDSLLKLAADLESSR